MKWLLVLLSLVCVLDGNTQSRRLLISPPKAAASGVSTVLEFDSASPSLADGFTLAASGTTFSVVGWIKPLATGNDYGTLIVQGSTGGVYYRGTSKKMDMFIAGDNLNSTALTVGSWNHFAVVVNGGSVQFYLNGATDGTGTILAGFSANKIGSDAGVNALKARLALLAVHSIALNGTQVANLYNQSTTSLAIGSLLAYWKFDEGSGTTAADSSGNGKNATLTSTTWRSDTIP